MNDNGSVLDVSPVTTGNEKARKANGGRKPMSDKARKAGRLQDRATRQMDRRQRRFNTAVCSGGLVQVLKAGGVGFKVGGGFFIKKKDQRIRLENDQIAELAWLRALGVTTWGDFLQQEGDVQRRISKVCSLVVEMLEGIKKLDGKASKSPQRRTKRAKRSTRPDVEDEGSGEIEPVMSAVTPDRERELVGVE